MYTRSCSFRRPSCRWLSFTTHITRHFKSLRTRCQAVSVVSVDAKHHLYLYQPAKTGRVVELESSHKVVEIRLRVRVCGKQRVASYNLTVKTYPPSTLPATCYLSKCRGKGRTPWRPLRRSLTSGWRLGTERRPSAGNNATRSRPTSRQDTDFGQLPALIKAAMESLSDTAEHTPSVKYLSRTRRPLKLAYTESVAQGKQAIRRPLFPPVALRLA